MRLLLLSVLFLVAACSSGSDAPPPVEIVIEPTVELTADNALDASAAAVRAAFDIERVAFVGASFLNLPRPSEEPAPGTGTSPTVLSNEVFGPSGGSATFTWDDRDADRIYSSGDVFTIALDQYADQSVVLDGTMQITDVVLTGLVPSDGVWILDATLDLFDVRVGIGSQEWPVTARIPFHLENRIIVQLFGAELVDDLALGPYVLQKGNAFARYVGDEAVSYVYDGAVYSAELDGVLGFASDGTMGGFPFFADPTTGRLHVFGSKGSWIELEPGFFTLFVRLDTDGDEEFDEEQVSSFFAMLP